MVPSEDMHKQLIPEQGHVQTSDVTVDMMTPSSPYDKCHLGWSIVSVFMCGLFGLVALVTSLLGYTDYHTGKYDDYAKKRRCAIGLIFTALFFGAFIIGLIINYYASLHAG